MIRQAGPGNVLQADFRIVETLERGYKKSMSTLLRRWRLVLGWSAICLATSLQGQTNENPYPFEVSPPEGTIFIEGTTNLLQVVISNAIEITEEETNIFFTDIVVEATTPLSPPPISFNDTGDPPDSTAEDYTFSGELITPLVNGQVDFPVVFTVIGQDQVHTNESGQVEPVFITNTLRVVYTVVSRPDNDMFTNAFKIDSQGGVVTGTNSYASLEPGEPKHADVPSVDASVWWIWSSPSSTNVLIDVAGSSFKPVLAVYTGTAVNQLTLVGASTNDFINRLPANVQFDAIRGTTYRIAVSGYDTNGQGNIRLRVAPGAEPDTHPPTVSISTPPREALITTELLNLTGTAKEIFLNDSGISNVWIQVGNAAATNAIGTASWQAQVVLPPGTNIVRAYAMDFAGNVGPADTVVVRYINPTNDMFTSATELTGVGGLATAINGRAGREPGEPFHADNDGGHSIWYFWRAPADGELWLSTAGSDFDTLLASYIGTNMTNLTLIAGNDDVSPGSGYSELRHGVISNQVYYFAIDGYGGASGAIEFQYALTTPNPGQFYSMTVSNTPGGTASPPSGLFPEGARLSLSAVAEPNFEFIGWEGTYNVADNPLAITITGDVTVTARFRLLTTPQVMTDDFESGDLRRLAWQTTTNRPWAVQTNVVSGGRFSARSPEMGHSLKSSLSIVTNLLAGSASFELRVSSEAGWDFLEFHLNGKLQRRWSGEAAWQTYWFDVPAGTNRLEWVYSKDANFVGGQDAAFLDNIYLPLDKSSQGVTQPELIITWLPAGQAQITLLGLAGQTYVLEASEDWVFWIPIGSGSSPSGIVQFLDDHAAQFERRFYRAYAQ